MNEQLANIYDEAYAQFTPEWLDADNMSKIDRYLNENNEGLINFYEDYASQFHFPNKSFSELKVLDLGCGLGGMSLYFANKGAQVTGVDISKLAISNAKQIARNKGLDINYIQGNFADMNSKLSHQFDLIFDSHLLHCLCNEEQRLSYLRNVREHLNEQGLYLCETMTYPQHLQIPVGYSFDGHYNILKHNGREELEYRKVLPSIEIEQEFLKSSLSICYLYYHAELSFRIYPEYSDFPHEYSPRTLRIAAKG